MQSNMRRKIIIRINYMDKQLFEFSQEQLNILTQSNSQKSALMSPYAARYEDAVYFDARSNRGKVEYSNPFITDCDRIINNALYNRYTDKTQVFSFYRNDDVTRRGAHVQLVSRIARTIGSALNLNLDLIEAIALGHDLGHTPFGHQGEHMLSTLYHSHCGKIFNHNVHSFRILHNLTNGNCCHGLTVQTLDGVLCHNGEKVHEVYTPRKTTPQELLDKVALTYSDPKAISTLRPSTLEGCVVRISDMIAYIGKDRQDLIKVCKTELYSKLQDNPLGKSNSDIIPKLVKNIIINSLGKPYIGLSKEVYEALDNLKKDNYKVIYSMDDDTNAMYRAIDSMMTKLYDKFLGDLINKNFDSSVYKHHLNNKMLNYSLDDSNDDIIVDYIASMTDDYFIDIYKFYFGDDNLSKTIKYVPYEYDLI